jgi:putative ABC transport system permease protein
MTFRWEPSDRLVRKSRQIEPNGRLAPGVSLAAASAQLVTRFAELANAYPDENGNTTVAVMPLADWMLGRRGPNSNLLPLLAAVAVALLLVSYLNVATLAIGCAEARRHETALRTVLGASGWRQWNRRLAEGTGIAGMGATGGALLAFWSIPLVLTRYGTSIPRAATIAPDAVTGLVIAIAATIGAAMIAVSGTRSSIAAPSDFNRRTATGALTLRRRLVAVQIGLASGLVYGAMLLGGTLASLARVDLGVPLDHALTFSLGANAGRYTTPDQIHQFFSDVEDQLRQLPGVVAVGATTRLPFFGGTNGSVSAADDPSRIEPIAEWRVVTPEFFAALGLPVNLGRDFLHIPRTSTRLVVISEMLAASLFPSQTAVGRVVKLEDGDPYEVVGVVGDLRDFGPTRPGRPTVYLRHGSEAGFASATTLNLVLRSRGNPLSLVPAIRERLRTVDSDAAIQNVQTLATLAVQARGASRMTATTVVVTLAALALLLGMIGVFGVVTVGVEQRTREIGVRLALGDTPPGIIRRILADGARMSLAGLALGTASAWLIHQLIGSFLVQSASPSRPASAALAIGVLMIATLVACVVPARRAAQLSPVDALRAE